MGEACRACRRTSGQLVLDLGEQPACDYFPAADDPGPDPVYPLQMWLCSSCGLAQLVADPTVPEEPRGAEPAALVGQAADAVDRVAGGRPAAHGARVPEYGSPHGGSWLDLLAEPRPAPVPDGASADVILDCFGLMHAPDQAAALAERAARLAPGGVLLLQYHALDTIVRLGQWNALRHGHYAYYSATALAAMLAARLPRPPGLDLRPVRRHRAAGRQPGRGRQPDGRRRAWSALLTRDQYGRQRPGRVAGLQEDALRQGAAARLAGRRACGRAGGAGLRRRFPGGRAAALGGADRTLIRAVADASPAKQGLRMPGTDIRSWPGPSLAAHPGARRAVRVGPAARGAGGLPGGGGGRRPLGGRRDPGAGQPRAGRSGSGPVTAAADVPATGHRWMVGAAGPEAEPGSGRRVGPMLPIGQPQLIGDLGVRPVGRPSAARSGAASAGQPGHRLPDPGGPLGREQRLVDFRLRGPPRRTDHLRGPAPPACGGQAAQALVPRRGRQPGAHPVRVLDPVDVLQQPEPGRLEYVGRIALPQLEVAGDGPDEPRILVEQPLPRVVITPCPARRTSSATSAASLLSPFSMGPPRPYDYRTESFMSVLSRS